MIHATLYHGAERKKVAEFLSINRDEALRFAIGTANDRLRLKLRYPKTGREAALFLKMNTLVVETRHIEETEAQAMLAVANAKLREARKPKEDEDGSPDYGRTVHRPE